MAALRRLRKSRLPRRAGVLALFPADRLCPVPPARSQPDAAATVLGAAVPARADGLLRHVRVHAVQIVDFYRLANVVRGGTVASGHTALFVLAGAGRAEQQRAGAEPSGSAVRRVSHTPQ